MAPLQLFPKSHHFMGLSWNKFRMVDYRPYGCGPLELCVTIAWGGNKMRTTMIALRTEWQRRWDFNGSPKKLVIAALAIATVDVLGMVAEHYTLVPQFYGAPFVAVVAVIASRLGMRSGLLASTIASLSCNYLFQGDPPHGGFNWPTSGEWLIYLSMFAVSIAVARVRQPPNTRVFDRGPDLPFTSRSDGQDGKPNGGGMEGSPWVYWDVRPSGKWAEDTHLGTEYLRILDNRFRNSELVPQLSWIFHDMVRMGRWSGVESGFCSALQKLAFRREAPHPAEQPQQSLD